MTKRESSNELIERWIQGDREAARRIHDLYYRKAWRFGLSILGQETEADDLAAEAIAHGLDVVRDPARRPAKFTGWLLGVVKHMAWRRAERRGQAIPIEMKIEDTRHGRPSGAIIESEMAGVLKRALAGLTPDERSLVEEKVVRKTPRLELARRLGCSIDTIDRRFKLAMARLRSFLSGHFTTLVFTGPAPTMERVLALRPSFRTAFLARHVEGLGAEAAAAKLGIPVATLEERLQYAYDSLGCTERTDFAPLRRPV